MRKQLFFTAAAAACLILAAPAAAQFTPEEAAEQPKWEEFLEKADIMGQEQMVSSEAVTSPWKLTLKLGDLENFALWKGIDVRAGRYPDSWKWEVAAYRLDRLLELYMVPATIERRFKENRGSLQIWAKVMMSLRDKETKKIKTPSYKIFPWNRALYLQRAFDNLIANEDRHQNNFLITEDWRLILIDHSRSFRTSKKFTKSLIYTDKFKEGPREMKELPRAFVEKLRALTAESVKAAVGEYLTDEEVAAVMIRRDLILTELDRIIKVAGGEDKVFY
ncbi:MAG: hypothetical protein JW747_01280 [Candidatus Aminicenantes bacterium]|nr:hypothetical protein [Candidatus Aminicenantes bacterium]